MKHQWINVINMKNTSPCPLHFSLHPLSLSYILVKCPKILILGFFLLLGSSLDISMILALDQSLRIQPIGSSRRLSYKKNGQNRLATIFFYVANICVKHMFPKWVLMALKCVYNIKRNLYIYSSVTLSFF